MAVRIETMIITADNKVKFVQLKEKQVIDIWEKKEKPEVLLAKDGRVLPIKDMLVGVQVDSESDRLGNGYSKK